VHPRDAPGRATYGFPTKRIMFEVTEGERVTDHAHLMSILTTYKSLGFVTAIDDFGAGYSGLNLLADFQPNMLKLDMALTRNIHADRVRRAIVFAILTVCRELDITPIAEGIECRVECPTLAEQGVELFQGYFFAKPEFEALPGIAAESWEAVTYRRL
jgi:EAL domain-containing protein (putative c-di-GMP-specific phosphodiesterase class I)